MAIYDYTVIGGGIVGLATAWHVLKRFPGARLLVLEKESGPAQHQTGRNSGVIHSGIYYTPGSYKARFARAGAESMVQFCSEHRLPHEVCGKLIVATRPGELPQIDRLLERARLNGVPAERITRERAREIEPHVECLAALHVKSTGIVSYRAVCLKLMELIEGAGGTLKFRNPVARIQEAGALLQIETAAGEYETKFVINCAGLHSDRVAQSAGIQPPARIVPFRGEYYKLVPTRSDLVRTLIYPVPNPAFPFLGVHFTKMVDGSVHAGPNAVLALGREAYRRTDVNVRDLAQTLAFPGFWKLAARNLDEGLKEMWRSVSKAAFTRSLQQLVPEVQQEDLVECGSGIRAQALQPDGKLVDDFLIVPGRRALHVCNAPSPAATASLEIGKEVARQVPAIDSASIALTS
jgi:L-2-hydroxyglutarate oxidase